MKELTENLKLDIASDLFVIPGNHDGVTRVEDKKLYVDALKCNPLSPAEACIPQLERAFEDYEAFVKQLIPDYPVEHPAEIHIRNWKDKINFIHCNTAIASDGRGEKQNQILNIDSLWMIKPDKNRVNIILAHNSFYDLNQDIQKRLIDFMRINKVAAYFCGDKHQQDFFNISINDKKNERVPCIVSFKSAPESNDIYSNFGMIIGEWDGEKAKVQGWTWKSGQGFNIDPKITGIEIDMNIVSKTVDNTVKQVEEQKTRENVSEQVKGEDFKNLELKRRVGRNYHRMTPYMIVKYNSVYERKGWGIRSGYTEKEISDYIQRAEEGLILDEINQFINALLSGD